MRKTSASVHCSGALSHGTFPGTAAVIPALATAATVVGAVLAAAYLVLTRLLGLAATLGLLVARRIAPVRLVRARAVLAEPRRTALRAVDCRGIDLPP